jgi:hypothetical protein
MADAAVYLEAGTTVSAERVLQARSSVRDWRVRALDPGALTAALARFGIEGRQDHLGTLVGVRSEADAAALLTRLIGEGIQVSTFTPAVGELEHTFLDLNRDAGAQPEIRGQG